MRKQHSRDSGYIAERMNPWIPGQKVVIYIAAEQSIDTSGAGRYAVVCVAHGTWAGTTSIPKARQLMKAPEEFCLDCRGLYP